MTDTLTITVIEPEELAPVGRLGEWLFAEGAALRMVRPWQGEAIPRLAELVNELSVVRGKVTLASGLESDFYVDMRRATLHHRHAAPRFRAPVT